MKIKINIIGFATIVAFSFILKSTHAQSGIIVNGAFINKTVADSLINEFRNTVYNTFYNTEFWTKNSNPTFTIIKVTIDKHGKIKDIEFSDSADPLFIKAYLNRHQYHNDISTLEKYAKVNSFSDISLLIPVLYEPAYSAKGNFAADKITGLTKFSGKYFEGNSIMLAPIKIAILKEHNM